MWSIGFGRRRLHTNTDSFDCPTFSFSLLFFLFKFVFQFWTFWKVDGFRLMLVVLMKVFFYESGFQYKSNLARLGHGEGVFPKVLLPKHQTRMRSFAHTSGYPRQGMSDSVGEQ